MLCFCALFFVVVDNKKNTHNNKRQVNEQNNGKALSNRMVHVVIMRINNRAEYQPNKSKDQTADKLPFPGNYK